MSGILEDHVEVIIPEKKKNAAVVHLILFFTCIVKYQLVTQTANKKRMLTNILFLTHSISGEYRVRTGDFPHIGSENQNLHLVENTGLEPVTFLHTGSENQNLHLVENTGLEPVTSCMPCKRSSQLS